MSDWDLQPPKVIQIGEKKYVVLEAKHRKTQEIVDWRSGHFPAGIKDDWILEMCKPMIKIATRKLMVVESHASR